MLTVLCSDMLQNAPFRSQIFKIFFASGGTGALTPPNQNPADVPGAATAAVDRYLLEAPCGRSAANLPVAAAVDRWDRHPTPVPHTKRAASTTTTNVRVRSSCFTNIVKRAANNGDGATNAVSVTWTNDAIDVHAWYNAQTPAARVNYMYLLTRETGALLNNDVTL